jgi:sulfate permease, SulP family
VVHSLVVLLAIVGLAGLLGLVPMAALAALLFIVAWNMSEPRLFIRTLRSAPGGDVAILLTCFLLTVLFDMVLAVGVGVGLAAALFIRQMALLTHTSRLPGGSHTAVQGLVDEMRRQGVALIFVGLKARMVLKLKRAGLRRAEGSLTFCSGIEQAQKVALRWLGASAPGQVHSLR